jgi:hypothetical protein
MADMKMGSRLMEWMILWVLHLYEGVLHLYMRARWVATGGKSLGHGSV